MKVQLDRKYPSIACCGIDCGLCPTYYTEGPSKCPGCGGHDFSNQHPSCSILTCCVKNNSFEICADCSRFPCEKLKPWDKADSFVTHKICLQNLDDIKQNGIRQFLEQQTSRIDILQSLLNSFNEGRSKNFFCIATTLLPIDSLTNAIEQAKRKIEEEEINPEDLKSKSKILKEFLNQYAKNQNIELKLRKIIK
ncbi:MAG: DUF3795 domain-containing protein [Candidatus Hermodarchaeota archaeon]